MVGDASQGTLRHRRRKGNIVSLLASEPASTRLLEGGSPCLLTGAGPQLSVSNLHPACLPSLVLIIRKKGDLLLLGNSERGDNATVRDIRSAPFLGLRCCAFGNKRGEILGMISCDYFWPLLVRFGQYPGPEGNEKGF